MTDEILELLLIVATLYGVLGLVLYWRRQSWVAMQTKHRRLSHWVIGLSAVLIHVTEDVLTGTSSHIDALLLAWIHVAVPAQLAPVFQVLTLSASAKVVVPMLALATAALLVKRRYWECAVLASSVLGSIALIYLAKTAIHRVRPTLWDTQWYWGSSFPSGHTLTAASLATAVFLCVTRTWPRARWPAFALATLWGVLVALSRLVLGVHWPTDVVAGLSAGVLLALSMAAAMDAIGTPLSKSVPARMEEI